MDSIQERLAKCYEQLSSSERVLADFVTNNPQDIALLSSTELAKVCHVSKSTVTRFFQRLGYESFREVKTVARRLRKQGVPIIEGNSGDFGFYLESESSSLQEMFQNLDLKMVENIVDSLNSARKILIIGFRNSYPLALHFRQQLTQLQANVSVAPQPGQSLGEEITGLDQGDFVVFLAFRRRPKIFRKLIETLETLNIPTLVIADSSVSGYRNKATYWLEAPLGHQFAFDSYSAPMSLISLLINSLSQKKPVEGQRRVDNISHNYAELEELSFDSITDIEFHIS